MKILTPKTAVREAVSAARQAAAAREAWSRARPSERAEARANADAAAHRAVRLILDPACLAALAAVAGPFLPGDQARPGEDA